MLPYPNHIVCKMAKGSIPYVGGNKYGTCPKGCRGKLVQVLNFKAGGAIDRAHTIMLLRRREEEQNPIKLKSWASKAISG